MANEEEEFTGDDWWQEDGYHVPQPVETSCMFCQRTAVGFVLVGVDVHPDQRVVVCADHGDFVCALNADFAAIDWWNEECERLAGGSDGDET